MVLALLAALGSGVAWAVGYLLRARHGQGRVVRLTVAENPTADGLAEQLRREHVVEKPWAFAWCLRITGIIERVHPGDIMLRDDLTPLAVLRALAHGAGLARVTFPEGIDRYDMAARLAAAGILPDAEAFVRETESERAVRRNGLASATLEGYLFPDTYDFVLGDNVETIVDTMVRTFRRRMADLRREHGSTLARLAAAGYDERAVVTLASMVERETGSSEDRPRVAAVFLNRLTRADFVPRLMQSDPTLVYGCRAAPVPSCPDAGAQERAVITRAMLDDASNPYNTYRHTGLPPGPIGNPGVQALRAVLAPAHTDDLYFVAMGNGRSAFARTVAEHEANVRRYLRTRDASP